MKKVVLLVVLLCLQSMGLYAAESTPLLGGYSQPRYQQTCRDRLSKYGPVALVAGGVAFFVYWTCRCRLDHICSPDDTPMNGACWNAVRRLHAPAGMPNLVTHSYDRGHGPVKSNTTITAGELKFSSAVQALANLSPHEPIMCLRKMPCAPQP